MYGNLEKLNVMSFSAVLRFMFSSLQIEQKIKQQDLKLHMLFIVEIFCSRMVLRMSNRLLCLIILQLTKSNRRMYQLDSHYTPSFLLCQPHPKDILPSQLTFDMSLRPRSTLGSGFFSKMPAS